MAIGGGAIRAGRAFVELFADSNKLYRALDAAKKKVLDFAKATAKIGVGAAGVGGAVLTPIAKFFTDAVSQGADIEQLAQRFHTTAESISTLRGAFAQAGVSGEEFGGIMDGLATKIAGAADSRDELIHGLQGLRGDFLLGKGVDEQLDLIAEKFKTIKAAEDQIRVANELGLGGMLPYLKQGKKGLDDMRAAAVANGDAMNGDDAKAALTIQKEYNRTMLAVKSTLVSVGKALLPTGKGFADIGAEIRSGLQVAREWVSANKQVIVVVTAVAAGLVAGGAALVTFATGMAVLAPLLTATVVVAKALVAAFLALASPVGLVVIGVAAIGAGLAYLFAQTESGVEVIGKLQSAFADFGAWIKGSWGGITDALKAGDWTLAFKIGIATVDVAWKGFVYGITATWIDFKSLFVDTFRQAVAGLKLLINDFGSYFEKVFTSNLKNNLESAAILIAAFDEGLSLKLANAAGKLKSGGQIELERKKREKEIVGEFIVNEDAARKARADSLTGAGGAFKQAIVELDRLKKEAAEAAKNAGKDLPILNDLKKDKPQPPSFTQLYANQKGIFGGNAQQQLGYGDQVAQRQLDAQNGIKAAAEAQVALLEELPGRLAGVWM